MVWIKTCGGYAPRIFIVLVLLVGGAVAESQTCRVCHLYGPDIHHYMVSEGRTNFSCLDCHPSIDDVLYIERDCQNCHGGIAFWANDNVNPGKPHLSIFPLVTSTSDVIVEATEFSGIEVSYSGGSAYDLIDGAITPSCIPSSGSIFPLGDTIVTCTATNNAGNTGSASFTITVEYPTPPETTIISAVDGYGQIIDHYGSTLSNELTITFSGTDNVGISGFKCKFDVDEEEYLPCTSPKIYTDLMEGTHTFVIFATDTSGNIEQLPVSFTWTTLKDSDSDGIPDVNDNCPSNSNPLQEDLDMDGKGDVCDNDDDNDNVVDSLDNCPINNNPTQSDSDYDGIGDVCDGYYGSDTVAKKIEDKVNEGVGIITSLPQLNGGNGLINKLQNIMKNVGNAVTLYQTGMINHDQYNTRLSDTLALVTGFDSQLEAKASNNQIPQKEADLLRGLSDEIRACIESLINNS